jgi:thiol-disulfide isomerase/thioredoxin
MKERRRLTRRATFAAVLVSWACGGDGDGRSLRPLTEGDEAPAYEAETLSGEVLDVGATGGPVLLNVWATWCVPCREEMPALQMLHEELALQGLAVVGGEPAARRHVVERDRPLADQPFTVGADRTELLEQPAAGFGICGATGRDRRQRGLGLSTFSGSTPTTATTSAAPAGALLGRSPLLRLACHAFYIVAVGPGRDRPGHFI